MNVKALLICLGCVTAIASTPNLPRTFQKQAPQTMEQAFSLHDPEYYAYMNLEQAEEAMKPVILEARKRIINRVDAWSQDGIESYILSPDGTKERVPNFHELFPADWEPINPEY